MTIWQRGLFSRRAGLEPNTLIRWINQSIKEDNRPSAIRRQSSSLDNNGNQGWTCRGLCLWLGNLRKRSWCATMSLNNVWEKQDGLGMRPKTAEGKRWKQSRSRKTSKDRIEPNAAPLSHQVVFLRNSKISLQLRISIFTGWGEQHQSKAIQGTPHWIEIKAFTALNWLDAVCTHFDIRNWTWPSISEQPLLSKFLLLKTFSVL